MSAKNERLHTAQWILERQLGWIAAADTKVAAVITLDLAMIAALGALGGTEKLSVWSKPDNAWAVVFCMLALVPILLSLCYAAAALLPRPEGPQTSMLYFGRVAEVPRADYVVKLSAVTDVQLLGDFAEQVHRNAEIAKEKFKNVRLSMLLGFLAMPAWVISVIAMMNRVS
jgi:hypothetical protein